MKKIIIFCFLFPLFFNGLNLQGWIALTISIGLSQAMAYLNVLLVLFGLMMLINKNYLYSTTTKIWILFFFVYYSIASFTSIIYNNPLEILKTSVSIIYFFGFYSFLRFRDFKQKFEITYIIIFIIANFLLIILSIYNIDFDYYGDNLEYRLDRAQGLYGDANNAALVAILGFAFIKIKFNPKNKYVKIIKMFILLMTFYALYLTFSTTGFATFLIVIVLLNYRFFTKIRLLFIPLIIIFFYILLINLNTFSKQFDLSPRQQYKIENFVSLLSFDFDKVDSSGRDELVANLLEKIYEKPIFGNGLDFGIRNRGHNTFLSIWADAGIFSLLLFLLILFIFFKRILVLSKPQKFFLLSLLIPLTIFMLSLQSIINQPYLMAIIVYIGYEVDKHKLINT